ncbi:MAG: Fur family transcriptional regulator [Candidatus Limisoma sp.]
MMTTDDKSVSMARSKLAKYLEENHLRKTPERFAILDMIYSHNDHFSVDTLCKEMEESSYHVSRSTVYYTMWLLCDCGLVRRHSLGTRGNRFEKVGPNSTSHYHLICTSCGKIREVKDAEMLKHISGRRYGAFSTSYFSLYVYGICSVCQRKKRKQLTKTK